MLCSRDLDQIRAGAELAGALGVDVLSPLLSGTRFFEYAIERNKIFQSRTSKLHVYREQAVHALFSVAPETFMKDERAVLKRLTLGGGKPFSLREPLWPLIDLSLIRGYPKLEEVTLGPAEEVASAASLPACVRTIKLSHPINITLPPSVERVFTLCSTTVSATGAIELNAMGEVPPLSGFPMLEQLTLLGRHCAVHFDNAFVDEHQLSAPLKELVVDIADGAAVARFPALSRVCAGQFRNEDRFPDHVERISRPSAWGVHGRVLS